MTETKLTEDDFETTYKVLETLRENEDGVNEALLNDAHYIVQISEERE
jgi:hypothetical protein